MKIFKHFETRALARKYISTLHPLEAERMAIRKKHGKHAKPYAVATPLEHLHFTPDAWVKTTKRKARA